VPSFFYFTTFALKKQHLFWHCFVLSFAFGFQGGVAAFLYARKVHKNGNKWESGERGQEKSLINNRELRE